jgi:hypothetical protein
VAEPAVDLTVEIAASPARVVAAFFDADALAFWWRAARTVTIARALGPYAIEWKPTEFRDEVLGRMGGVLRGTVMHVSGDEGFFVADVYWLPPDGDPIGPMALEVNCGAMTDGGPPRTRLHVRQSGFEESARWRRYYQALEGTWQRALRSLASLLEG